MRFPFPPGEMESALATAQSITEAEVMDSAAATLGSADGMAPALTIPPSAAPDILGLAPNDEPQGANPDCVIETQAPEPFPPDPTPELAPSITATPSSRPRSKRKVIAFPRQASSAPEIVHRLADPVIPEQPRILDVPEELEAYPATPLLDGLQFLPSPQASASPPADHVELPVQAVDISCRLYAAVIDCALVAMATGLFSGVCYEMLPKLPLTKPVLIIAAGVMVLLWGIYEYLFTMYACAAPGMRMLHLRLSTFKGGRLSWRQRRSRLIALYFSTASLMMGLLWALVDVDALCWHDRISRSYLSKRE